MRVHKNLIDVIYSDSSNIVCDFENGYERTKECKFMDDTDQAEHGEPWIWKEAQTETKILQDHTYESGTTLEFSRISILVIGSFVLLKSVLLKTMIQLSIASILIQCTMINFITKFGAR